MAGLAVFFLQIEKNLHVKLLLYVFTGLEITHEIYQHGEDGDWAKLFEPSNFFQKYK